MKYLLYCIFEPPVDRLVVGPQATAGCHVRLVEKEGLVVVFSEISTNGAAYDVSEIKRYHSVIDSFFNQVTVIPFRYGTILDKFSDVEQLLELRAEHYKMLLSELDGCVEMGIRAIIDENQVPNDGWCCATLPSLQSPNAGRLYLSGRRIHYWTESQVAQTTQRTAEHYRTAFEGMFRKFKGDQPLVSVDRDHRRTLVVSTYFLVPRNLIAGFRQTFLKFASEFPAKSLISGPWPPYNFVLPGDTSATQSTSLPS